MASSLILCFIIAGGNISIPGHSLIVRVPNSATLGAKLGAGCSINGSTCGIRSSRFAGRRRRLLLVDSVVKEAVYFGSTDAMANVGRDSLSALWSAIAPGAGSAEDRNANRFSVVGFRIDVCITRSWT